MSSIMFFFSSYVSAHFNPTAQHCFRLYMDNGQRANDLPSPHTRQLSKMRRRIKKSPGLPRLPAVWKK